MLTTAAGTIRPAQVLIVGVGVAGLLAIATAKRLGAQVEAYDVRSATKEQVRSLGAKFIDTGVSAEGQGGYARELTEEEKAQQQSVLEARVALAGAGELGNTQPGFELFDKQSLGESNFQQQVTYQRALQGQLAQTIDSIQGVSGASYTSAGFKQSLQSALSKLGR